MPPKLLTDLTRLKEIYKLRVDAWENSDRSLYINSLLYPDGWFDNLDPLADHIVILDKDVIIASIRVNYFSSFTDHPFYNALNHLYETKEINNLGYISRLVVDKKYRRQGLTNLMFDYAELVISKNQKSLACLDATGFQVQNLIRLGYKEVGTLNTQKINWNIEPNNQILLIKKLDNDKIYN